MKHFIEDFATWLFGASALGQRLNNRKPLGLGNGVQFRKLSDNREHLAIIVFARFATIDEVFEHETSLSDNISYCESENEAQSTITKNDGGHKKTSEHFGIG